MEEKRRPAPALLAAEYGCWWYAGLASMPEGGKSLHVPGLQLGRATRVLDVAVQVDSIIVHATGYPVAL